MCVSRAGKWIYKRRAGVLLIPLVLVAVLWKKEEEGCVRFVTRLLRQEMGKMSHDRQQLS